MALAEWGVDAAEMEPLALRQMMAAYGRRKEYEAEVQALQIVKWLGKALDGGKGTASGRGRRGGRQDAGAPTALRQRVSANSFLSVAGKEMKRA